MATKVLTASQYNTIVAAAKAALVAINNFISSNGTSPNIPLTEVLTFQTLDGTLTADGKYGPNTASALQWYLKQTVPAYSSKYEGATLVWGVPLVNASTGLILGALGIVAFVLSKYNKGSLLPAKKRKR